MKNAIKKLTVIMVILTLMSPFICSLHVEAVGDGTASSPWDISGNEDGSVTAVLSEDGGTLTISGTGAMKDWDSTSDIPWYAEKDNLEEVIINEGVTNIGANAFNSCYKVPIIELPSSVTTIGDDAFHACMGLKNIELPDSVITIGSGAFMNCWSLTSIKIPYNVGTIQPYTFYGCKELESVDLQGSILEIGDYAFAGCTSLTNIEIPSCLTRIGYDAFSHCSEDLVIICYEGSAAETYAEQNNIKYIKIIGEWDISENEDGSVTAVLTDDGILTISGTGAMRDWNRKW